jgi:hypothetical protein
VEPSKLLESRSKVTEEDWAAGEGRTGEGRTTVLRLTEKKLVCGDVDDGAMMIGK